MIKTKKQYSVKEVFETHIKGEALLPHNELHLLYDLVRYFRPKRASHTISLLELIGYLQEHPSHCRILSDYIKNLLSNRHFGRMISEVGILQDSSFFYELRKRIMEKFIPFQPEKDTLQYVLNQVFYRASDYIWLEKIDHNEYRSLFELLNFTDIFASEQTSSYGLNQLCNAIGLITQRMSGRSLESDIIYMVPEYGYLESPFLSFEREFEGVRENLLHGEPLQENNINYKQLMVLFRQCQDFVQHAYKNTSKYGITMRVNQGLLRINQQLARVKTLIDLLVVNTKKDKIDNTICMALKLIEYNCYKNNIRSFIKESTQTVAYEITQFNASTGEKYITETAKDYFKMLRASLGAGFIVGFLCIFKILLHKVDTSEFGHAFLYSMNYAFGFILIYLTGSALATKQPSMTATTVARVVEEGMKKQSKEEDKHSEFAEFFARLWRSQFIAFVGNVIIAFGVALLLVWGIDKFLGENIVAHSWEKLLSDASPTHSKLILHAAIAGVFLFISGIIAGNVSNNQKHNQIAYRIEEHPFLKRMIGTSKSKKLGLWIAHKYPGIISNFWFGVFMGSTFSIGSFLGLDLDIRHITFVSGNIAMGLYGTHFYLIWSMWIWIFIGLIIVGFINFIVSFGLSIWIAFRSRNIPSSEVFSLIKAVFRHLKKAPMSFIFPPKQKKKLL
ncbi:recombinase [Capnocytophaga sp. G2]|uniref:recombinase n=1 Tax=Capnocytophaga sp. G2 TaxID=3110695 RepID=UPI002B4A6B83|nr:recombinase [Capnocytophaga sp. G2]MEB3005580.1 recombinase [Capnocytophaga sp. G2]